MVDRNSVRGACCVLLDLPFDGGRIGEVEMGGRYQTSRRKDRPYLAPPNSVLVGEDIDLVERLAPSFPSALISTLCSK